MKPQNDDEAGHRSAKQPVAVKPITHIQKNGSVVNRIELIRPADLLQQSELLDQLRSEAAELGKRPGFVSLNLFASTDSPLIITFVQWDREDRLTDRYSGSLFEQVIQHRFPLLGQRGADIYSVVSSDSNDHSEVSFRLDEPFVTILDVMQYYGNTRDQREKSLDFNLKNGAGYMSQPGCHGIAVMRNADLTRAVSIGQWTSSEHFLAAVRNTAPGPIKWLLVFVRSIPKLNAVLQFFGRILQNRPEYQVYRLHYALVIEV